MKRKQEFDESELYVINKPLTKKEEEEISVFIKEYKRTHKMVYPKNLAPPPKKSYSLEQTHAAMLKEPEPALYDRAKPATKKHRATTKSKRKIKK